MLSHDIEARLLQEARAFPRQPHTGIPRAPKQSHPKPEDGTIEYLRTQHRQIQAKLVHRQLRELDNGNPPAARLDGQGQVFEKAEKWIRWSSYIRVPGYRRNPGTKEEFIEANRALEALIESVDASTMRWKSSSAN